MNETIFYLDNGVIKLRPEVIALTEHLQKLEESELKYIIIAYDYIAGPHRLRPIDERKIIACRTQFGENIEPDDVEDTEIMKLCISEYNSLIYNPTLFTIETYKSKVDSLNQELSDMDIKDSKDTKKLNEIDTAITILLKKIEESEEKYKKEEDKILLKGNKALSFIEKLQRSRKLYDIQQRAKINRIVDDADNF